jgi:hypothetical protein
MGKKIKSAHDAKKKRGEPAGNAPYGYRKSEDGKKLVLDGDAAETVKLIFDMRLEGNSTSQIARHLTRNSIPSPQQRRYELGEIGHDKFSGRIVWPATMVSKLLRNEVYTGSLFQGKYACNGKTKKLLPPDKWIVHENTHEAIVSKEQFNAVSQLMTEAAARYEHKNLSGHYENNYAGKIICSRCGKVATRSDNRLKPPVLYYYSCRHCCIELREENGLSKAPKLPLLKLDALVMATLRVYMDMLVQFDNLPEILSNADPLIQKRARIAKDRVSLGKIINGYEKTLSTAYTHHLEGLLDFREYQLVREKVENDKQNAEARLTSICAEQAKYDVKNVLENKWLIQYRAYRNNETPTKEMIQVLIGQIILTPMTNHVDIILNFSESFEELQNLIQESGVTVDAVQRVEAVFA